MLAPSVQGWPDSCNVLFLIVAQLTQNSAVIRIRSLQLLQVLSGGHLDRYSKPPET